MPYLTLRRLAGHQAPASCCPQAVEGWPSQVRDGTPHACGSLLGPRAPRKGSCKLTPARSFLLVSRSSSLALWVIAAIRQRDGMGDPGPTLMQESDSSGEESIKIPARWRKIMPLTRWAPAEHSRNWNCILCKVYWVLERLVTEMVN